MAFSYDLSTQVGELRLRLSDTNPKGYGFEDAELAYFLSSAGSLDAATVKAVRVLLTDAARRAKSFTDGERQLSYSDSGRVAGLQAVLKLYGGDLVTATVITPRPMPMDSGYVEVVPTLTTS